jgi:hypothetical protein
VASPKQLDLFDLMAQDEVPKTSPPAPSGKVTLNGMYYEQSTGLFVSYVLGRRHLEVTPDECLGLKEWKKRTMKERAI